ncbi:MAG: DUF1990 domain-containing protein [Bacteroidia bacterium]|nr:DUF1990 domain-containing protein [Bacteroidia bacterium]
MKISFSQWEYDKIESFRKKQLHRDFSYPFPLITLSNQSVRGWNRDIEKAMVGKGEPDFLFFKKQLIHWEQFNTGWTKILTPEPAHEGQTVVVMVKTLGICFYNTCRVVKIIDEPNRFGVIYGTLPRHAEKGEELFMISVDEKGDVWYEIKAFSRPNYGFIWLGYPFLRYLQERFRKDSVGRLQSLSPS